MTKPTLIESLSAGRDWPPFAAGDPDLLKDWDLRSSIVGTDGVTNAGTSGVFDETLGYKGGPNGNLFSISLNLSAIEDEFTVYVELSREGITTDNSLSNRPAGGSFWADSTGRTTSALGYPMMIESTTGDFDTLRLLHVGTTSGAFRVELKAGGGSTASVTTNLNSHLVDGQDEEYAAVVIVFRKGVFEVYVDGVLVASSTTTGTIPVWNNCFFAVGAFYNGTSRWGNYYVRRIQIANRAAARPFWRNPRIGLIGDSFAQSYSNRANAAGYATDTDTTVAAVDAVQNGLVELRAQTAGELCIGSYGTSCMVGGLLRYAAMHGFEFAHYNAARSGDGWSDTLSPIPSNYIDALVAYDPEIVLAFASVNDVNTGTPVNSTILGDIEAKLDTIIDGCSSLRKILFFGIPPGHKNTESPAHSSAAWLVEHKALNAAIAGVNGYRNVVEFVDSYYALGGDDYPRCFNIGPCTEGKAATNDIHPGAHGQTMIADLVWPHLWKVLSTRP